jgi:hypothetical protein
MEGVSWVEVVQARDVRENLASGVYPGGEEAAVDGAVCAFWAFGMGWLCPLRATAVI